MLRRPPTRIELKDIMEEYTLSLNERQKEKNEKVMKNTRNEITQDSGNDGDLGNGNVMNNRTVHERIGFALLPQNN